MHGKRSSGATGAALLVPGELQLGMRLGSRLGMVCRRPGMVISREPELVWRAEA